MSHACDSGDIDESEGYGPAVTTCLEDEHGRFIASNGEYDSYVRFCPYCGAQARTPPTRVTWIVMRGDEVLFQDAMRADWGDRFASCYPSYSAADESAKLFGGCVVTIRRSETRYHCADMRPVTLAAT